MDAVMLEVKALAESARRASADLALKSADERNAALAAMAAALRERTPEIIEANEAKRLRS